MVTFPVPQGATSVTFGEPVFGFPAAMPRFGLSASGYAPAAAAGVTPVAFCRIYNDESRGIPAAYPGTGEIPAGAAAAVSLRPEIAATLTGQNDAALAAYFKMVRPGDLVTCWHEGERANLNIPAAQLLALHAHVSALFTANAPLSAKYGQVFTAYSATQNRVTGWAAPGMAFYAVDAYPATSTDTPASVLGPWLTQLDVPDALVSIWETNSSFSATQAAWLQGCWDWAVEAGAGEFIPFFGQSFTWSAATAPPDVVATLIEINNASRG